MKHVYEYHTHTTWCHHSIFTIDHLVQTAIDHQFKELGISEHIYSAEQIRETSLVNHQELLQYVSQVAIAKTKYRNQIKILCGFELEIIDQFSGKLTTEVNNKVLALENVDYGIHALHYYGDGKHVSTTNWNAQRADFIIQTYKQLVNEQKVRYIAHPDAFMEGVSAFDANAQRVAEAIAKLAVKHQIVLGFNVNGLIQGRKFPSREFWQVVQKTNALVKIELDAHSLKPFNQTEIKKAYEIAQDLKLNLVQSVNWK